MVSKILRSVGIALGLAICLFFTVCLPVSVVMGTWAGLSSLCALLTDTAAHWPALSNKVPWRALHSCSNSLPTISAASTAVLAIFAVTAAAFLVAHSLIPMRYRLNKLFNGPTRLPPDHPLQGFVDRLRDSMGGPKARVWVIPSRAVTGYAVSGPLFGNAIILSSHVVEQIDREVCRWIVAHEYGHIRLGHTHTSTLWLVSMGSLTWLGQARQRFNNGLLHTIRGIPLVGRLSLPLSGALWLLESLTSFGLRFGVKVFLLLDRWASRRMELEADQYAAMMCGSAPGIWLFEQLQGAFEPRFGSIFATHPSHKSRAMALRKSQACAPTRP